MLSLEVNRQDTMTWQIGVKFQLNHTRLTTYDHQSHFSVPLYLQQFEKVTNKNKKQNTLCLHLAYLLRYIVCGSRKARYHLAMKSEINQHLGIQNSQWHMIGKAKLKNYAKQKRNCFTNHHLDELMIWHNINTWGKSNFYPQTPRRFMLCTQNYQNWHTTSSNY